MVGYMGGKARQSKHFAIEINKALPGRDAYWEPFCGMCSVGAKVTHPYRTFSDINPYVIAMHQALQNGWIPPAVVTVEDYHKIKQNPNADMALAGFVGFGCSFGGIFFSGYARYSKFLEEKGMSFAKSAFNSSQKRSKELGDSTFNCMDYRDFDDPVNLVIYADPPYQGVSTYNNGAAFDHEEFWLIMDQWAENNTVFVSAYEEREGWGTAVALASQVTLSAATVGKKYRPQAEYLMVKSRT